MDIDYNRNFKFLTDVNSNDNINDSV